MLPLLGEKFGNPHSVAHAYGWQAADAVEIAREQIAATIGAEPREIVFTSGATESNNLALKGVARAYRERKTHLVTCVTEHKCVLESARRLEREGFRVTYLPVGADGLIDARALEAAIGDQTALVSVMAVNNEIGVVQPLAEIGAACRRRGVVFHTDAAQAFGKIDLDVNGMNVDLMSVSGHKIYGPKGIGALYVRRRPRVRLVPEMDGGGQEGGLRAGTLPAPLCVGLGAAAAIAKAEMAEEAERLWALRRRLLDGLLGRLPGLRLNGHAERRIPGNLNLSFEGVESEDLIAALPDLAVSSGAACASATHEPSYVLAALGLDENLVLSSLRIGLGRFTTEAEVDHAARRIAEEAARLRRTNPRRPRAPAEAARASPGA
jgi:cysteine desulfurase